jgi:hypothetical protein
MQFTEKRLRVKWYGRLDVAWLAMCVLVQTARYHLRQRGVGRSGGSPSTWCRDTPPDPTPRYKAECDAGVASRF